ncbi:hypothetical protein ACCAA_370036 [Candidatus Accumulibacter aalborgensis]|uniref:Uncharacterized protein n=1 Tax=Candidatus Accumulibacter aalborgensis TaxID=1860102 RepID=A0A1A8XQL5_9PROT|nr:hypothetical protein ACCAA_370036 [Candidatus Accumulibacter aalborgensis]
MGLSVEASDDLVDSVIFYLSKTEDSQKPSIATAWRMPSQGVCVPCQTNTSPPWAKCRSRYFSKA